MVELNIEVKSCSVCPMRGIDGGPSPAVCCNHPDAPDRGYIIGRCVEGFPQLCPLLKVIEKRNDGK